MNDSGIAVSPRSNPSLIGHTIVETRFLNIWQSGRTPHAWLLTGPKGVGKATLAFRMARFVLLNHEKQKISSGLFEDSTDLALN